jgi:hypothetical protein
MMAFAPLSVRMTGEILSETLFTFALTLGLWFWTQKRGFYAGLIFGVATLIRAILLPFLALIGVIALVFPIDRKTNIRIAIGAALLILPWTVRNAVNERAFIPIQTTGWGSNLFFGTIDVPYGSGKNPWEYYNAAVDGIVASTGNETEAEVRMLKAALDKIRQDPLDWLRVRAKQFPRLLVDTGMGFVGVFPVPLVALKIAFSLGSILFLLTALVGMALACREVDKYYPLWLFPIFMLIVQFPAYGEVRYILPAVPMMVILAAMPLARLIRSAPNRLQPLKMTASQEGRQS